MLRGSVALVTGASQGIGLAIRSELERRGVLLECSSLRESPGCAAVDVRDAKAVRQWVDAVVKRHGHIDLLVHSAGRAESVGPFLSVPSTEFQDVIDTNLTGTFHVLQSALPSMLSRGRGQIIVIGSRAGHRAHPLLAAYSASKFGVRGLCQAVAKELAETSSGVSCITIAPAGVKTPMREKLFGKENSDRQQSPESVANIVADIAEGAIEVANGSDVLITNGQVTEISPAS